MLVTQQNIPIMFLVAARTAAKGLIICHDIRYRSTFDKYIHASCRPGLLLLLEKQTVVLLLVRNTARYICVLF